MLGVTVNTVAVIIGSLLGFIFKKGIPEKISSSVQTILGFATLYVGIAGSLNGRNVLITIISLVIGTVIGTAVDIDHRLDVLGRFVESKFKHKDKRVSLGEGFVTASLIFCVGSMTIVGSLQAGINGNNEMLYTKSMLDFVLSIVLSSTLGIGVMLSAIFVLVFQGSIALLAGVVAPFLGDAVIAEMTCAGSILVMALAMNLTGLAKIKVSNFLPSVFTPIIVCPVYNWIAELVGGLV